MKPVPVDEYVDHLWTSVKSGSITWAKIRALQTESMPRCETHDRPANVKIGRMPLCEICVQEGRHRG